MGERRSGQRYVTVVASIAAALNGSSHVQAALEQTLALLGEHLCLSIGWVWLLDPGTQLLYLAAMQNVPPGFRAAIRSPENGSQCVDGFKEIASGAAAAENRDLLDCPRLGPALREIEPGLCRRQRHYASIGLQFQGRMLGLMNVALPDWRRLSRRELNLLSTLASQVSAAVERSRLAEENTRVVRLEERTRLAREIHDGLAQGLTGIILHLEGALSYLDRQPDRGRKLVCDALSAAQENLQDARRSVLDLRATALEGKPLAEALFALSRSFSAETGIALRTLAVTDRVLPPHIEGELYRIAKEALTNIHRHARATEGSIRLRTIGDRTRLSIQDNGQGFDPGRIPAGRFGIIGMRERARIIGGSLRVVSVNGRGTAVAVVVPLDTD